MRDLISEYIGRLKKADDELTQAIASGINIHDFASYQKLVGKLEGLKEAFDILNQLLTEDEEDL
jgi:hypothetical protein